jgi:hypothetical protein
VATRRDLENQIRGLLKTLGLVLGTARRGRFEVRLRDLLTAEPGLSRLIDPLLQARSTIIERSSITTGNCSPSHGARRRFGA